jgi:transposase
MLTLEKTVIIEMLKTKSVSQIAKELGINFSTLYSYCQARNINTSRIGKKIKKEKPLDEDKMVGMYLDGKTFTEIAEIFEVGRTTAQRRIKRKIKNIRNQSDNIKNALSDLSEEEKKIRTKKASAVRKAKALLKNLGVFK